MLQQFLHGETQCLMFHTTIFASRVTGTNLQREIILLVQRFLEKK